MRTGLLAIGLIFLVLGGIVYLAENTTVEPYEKNVLAQKLAVLSMVLGAMLTILGLVLPDPEGIYHDPTTCPVCIKNRRRRRK